MVFEVRNVISLPQRQHVCLKLDLGATICCTGGCVWITEDHVNNDVVLETGQSYSALGKGAIMVGALHDAELFVRQEQFAGVTRPYLDHGRWVSKHPRFMHRPVLPAIAA